MRFVYCNLIFLVQDFLSLFPCSFHSLYNSEIKWICELVMVINTMVVLDVFEWTDWEWFHDTFDLAVKNCRQGP